MLIDTHAHLEMPEFAADLPAVLERAREAGISHIVSASVDLASLHRNLEIASANSGFVTATAGVHPNETAAVTPQQWDEIARLAADPRVVAIGETGLDYHRDRSPRDRQAELFVRHIALARDLGKPLVVHSRAAAADTFAILERERAGDSGGVLHCFSGTREDGERALALGFFVSFAGPLTYPRSALPEAARALPTERMLLETDAPFLAPQAHRGRRNEPAFVAQTASALAAIKGLAERDVRRITTRNACSLFRLPCPPAAPEIAYPIRNSLYLNVTSRCSNRCTFCTRESSRIVKGHDLSLEHEPTTAEILAAAGDTAGYDEVVFCGFGEPLLRWDVVREVALVLKGRGARVRINTNGQARLFLGRDILPEMAGVIDALSVSLNAPDAARYAKICRPDAGETAYEAVRKFIREARNFVPSVTASVVALPGVDIEACRRIAEQELGAAFRIRPYNEVG
ncbi:MAG: TatD family nuclease-associated radical SAM protein [Candidatus Methylomirabilia bacterium]